MNVFAIMKSLIDLSLIHILKNPGDFPATRQRLSVCLIHAISTIIQSYKFNRVDYIIFDKFTIQSNRLNLFYKTIIITLCLFVNNFLLTK